MTTDEAIEFVAADMAARKDDPEWSLDVCRSMVELARNTISRNPQRFVDKYLDSINAHAQAGKYVRRDA